MIQKNKEFSDLEKKIIEHVPAELVSATRALPEAEHAVVIKNIYSAYFGEGLNIENWPIANKEINMSERYLLSIGYSEKVIFSLRMSYIESLQYSRALGRILTELKKN